MNTISVKKLGKLKHAPPDRLLSTVVGHALACPTESNA
jgi:hypothetical protein